MKATLVKKAWQGQMECTHTSFPALLTHTSVPFFKTEEHKKQGLPIAYCLTPCYVYILYGLNCLKNGCSEKHWAGCLIVECVEGWLPCSTLNFDFQDSSTISTHKGVSLAQHQVLQTHTQKHTRSLSGVGRTVPTHCCVVCTAWFNPGLLFHAHNTCYHSDTIFYCPSLLEIDAQERTLHMSLETGITFSSCAYWNCEEKYNC